jgi:hypothetical protein
MSEAESSNAVGAKAQTLGHKLRQYAQFVSFGVGAVRKESSEAEKRLQLIAVACSDEDPSTHFPTGANSEQIVIEFKGKRTKLKTMKGKHRLKNMFFTDPRTKKRKLMHNDREWRSSLVKFNKYLDTVRVETKGKFFADCKQFLSGSDKEFQIGLKMFYEAGNYPEMHCIDHLSACGDEVDAIVNALGDADKSILWMDAILGIWAWSTTNEMQNYLIGRGVLEYISPGADNHILFSVCTRQVAKAAAGLLSSITTQADHCITLIDHGTLLACLDILEGPKARDLETKEHLLQTIHHCLLEAEVLGNVYDAINTRPESAIIRKHEKTFVERIMGIFTSVSDNNKGSKDILTTVATILGIVCCDRKCADEYFHLPTAYTWITKHLKESVDGHDPEDSDSISVIIGLGKCMWCSAYFLAEEHEIDPAIFDVLMSMLTFGNSKVCLSALAALACFEYPTPEYNEQFVGLLDTLLLKENNICKKYALTVLARQAALFPEKVLKSESVAHIIHLASSSACVLRLRIHALRALAEIITVGVAPVVSGVDISGLLHMAKEEENMTLKTLTLYVLWVFSTYPREVSFSKDQKILVVEVSRQLFEAHSTKIEFVSYVLVLLWTFTYDPEVKEYMIEKNHMQFYAKVVAELHSSWDRRSPSELVQIGNKSNKQLYASNKQPGIDHFPEADVSADEGGSELTDNEDSRCKTCELVINIVWVLSSHQDGAKVAMDVKLYDSLLRLALATDKKISNTLRIKSSECLRWFCKSPHVEKVIGAYANETMLLSSILICMMQSSEKEIQAYVARCVSSLSIDKERRAYTRLGGAIPLVAFLRNPTGTGVLDSSLALFNLSVCTGNQKYLCRLALPALLNLARDRRASKHARQYAADTLYNLKSHPSNLTLFYKSELRLKTNSAFGAPKLNLQVGSIEIPQKKPAKPLDKKTHKLKNDFSDWYDKIRVVADCESNIWSSQSRILVRRASPRTDNRTHSTRVPERPQTCRGPRRESTQHHQMNQRGKSRPQTAGLMGSKMVRPPTRPRSPRLRPQTAGARSNVKHELQHRMRQPASRIWDSRKSRPSIRVNPWAPKVHHYETLRKEKNKTGKEGPGLKLKGKKKVMNRVPSMKVVLEPQHSRRSAVSFSRKNAYGKGKLCMWKHIKGNRVSKAINLKVYTTDTGDEVHYFQKPGLREPDSVKEVEIPKVPTRASSSSIQSIPLLTHRTFPSIELPPLDRHEHPPDPPHCTYARLKRYNAEINETHMCFSATREPIQADEKFVEDDVHTMSNAALDKSSFGLRPYLVESKDYYEKQNVYSAAFLHDWKMIMAKESFREYLHDVIDLRSVFAVDNNVDVFSDSNKAKDCTILLLENNLVTVVTKKLKKIECSVTELRFPRPQRGTEIMREEVMKIPLVQFYSACGCTAAKLREIGEFTMATIEVLDTYEETVQGSATKKGHHVKISGHSPFVEHAQSLVENAMMVGRLEVALRDVHKELSLIYYFFRGIDNEANALMTYSEFNLFVADAELADPKSAHCSRSSIRSIYNAVSKIGDEFFGRNYNSKSICRQEFMEIMLRISYEKYAREFQEDLTTSFQSQFKESLREHFGSKFLDDGNEFRRNHLYDEHVDHILEDNFHLLVEIFTDFSSLQTKHSSFARVHMTTGGWIKMMNYFQLVDSTFTVRDAAFAATQSMFAVVDDVKENSNYIDFPCFLEAMCRVADLKQMPDEHDLRKMGVSNVHDYFVKKNVHHPGHIAEHPITKHSDWITDKEEEWNKDDHLAHNIETLIAYIKESLERKRQGIRTVFETHKYEKWLLAMYKTRKFKRAVLKKEKEVSAIVMSPRAPKQIVFKSRRPRRRKTKGSLWRKGAGIINTFAK